MLEPTPTKTHASREFQLSAPARYIFGEAQEERSRLPSDWVESNRAAGVAFTEILEQTQYSFWSHEVGDPLPRQIASRNNLELSSLLPRSGETLYLDITGLDYSTWAPLLQAWHLSATLSSLYIVYAEPKIYSRSSLVLNDIRYSLTEKILGISPISGFARLSSDAIEDSLVVPMIGFEGGRLSYLLETLQAPESQIWPIIGMPGFQLNHPFDSLLGNRTALDQPFIRDQILTARANCPFDAFFQLIRLQRKHDGAEVRVAPIGTKPHGVGAVLFALYNPERVQLVYDHPKRASGRSAGVGSVLVYNVGSLLRSHFFQEAL